MEYSLANRELDYVLEDQRYLLAVLGLFHLSRGRAGAACVGSLGLDPVPCLGEEQLEAGFSTPRCWALHFQGYCTTLAWFILKFMSQSGNLLVSMWILCYLMVNLAGFTELSINHAVLETHICVWMSNQFHRASGTVSNYLMKGSLGLQLIADKN